MAIPKKWLNSRKSLNLGETSSNCHPLSTFLIFSIYLPTYLSIYLSVYLYIYIFSGSYIHDRRTFRKSNFGPMERCSNSVESEKRKSQKRKSQQKEDQQKEDAGARKGRKVAKHCVFPMFCGSGGSKRRLAKAARADRQIDKQTDRQTDRQILRQTDSQSY